MNPIFSMEHLVALTALLAALCGFGAWRSSSKCGTRARSVITAARVLAVICLGVIALNPGRWIEESREREYEWAIMIDRSASMSTRDANNDTRWNESVRLAKKALSFSINPKTVGIYPFSDKLESISSEDMEQLVPDGPTTDITSAGASLLNMTRSGVKRLSGILLISDGRQIETAARREMGITARAREVSIMAMPVGGEVATRDLSVAAGRRQYVGFPGQTVRVTAIIENKGMGNVVVMVQLLDSEDEKIAEQQLYIEDDKKETLHFDITPEKRGYHEYRLHVPSMENERTEVNNTASFGLMALDGKMKIFMAEGAPYWESKFLAQLLRKQPNMDVTSVYRVSSERFFKVETEAGKETGESEAVFPQDSEALAEYDFIVFGKGAEYFLSAHHIKLIDEFVKEQGGCVIFSRGKAYHGEFPEMESLEPVTWGNPVEREFSFSPTRAGEDSGLFGDMLAGKDDPVWHKTPTLKRAHYCAQVKPFAGVLAEGVIEMPGKNRTFPLVVSRRLGKGVVILVNADGMWQWDFFSSTDLEADIYKEFWTQLIQWAATYSEFLPGQTFSIRLSERSTLPDTPIRARITRRGTEKDKQPVLLISLDNTPVREIVPVKSGDTEENWEAVFSLSEPGVYRVGLADELNHSGPSAALNILPHPSENDNLNADPEFLRNLAETSGGQVIQENELEAIIRQFEAADAVVDMHKAVWAPSWDKWWFLCLMLSFFSIEWFLRRRNGLL